MSRRPNRQAWGSDARVSLVRVGSQGEGDEAEVEASADPCGHVLIPGTWAAGGSEREEMEDPRAAAAEIEPEAVMKTVHGKESEEGEFGIAHRKAVAGRAPDEEDLLGRTAGEGGFVPRIRG